jgi:threonylcarbamoyladenosine tRNA methylthiotransferase MtaB
MKRRHSRAQAIAAARHARLRPEVALGADLIAGFRTGTRVFVAASISRECELALFMSFRAARRPAPPPLASPSCPVRS